MVYAPTTGSVKDAEARRATLEAVDQVQLVLGREVVVVFVGARDEERVAEAKNKAHAEIKPLGLDFQVEGRATIDAHCTVRLAHDQSEIPRAGGTP